MTLPDLPPLAGFRVAFHSEDEVVIVKPAGVPSELTSDPRGVSVLERIRRNAPTAKLPHRLDRMTRGFLLLALTDASIRHHNREVRSGSWEKMYLARIVSPPLPDPILGPQRSYLRRRGDRMVPVRSGGQPALLEVVAIAPAPGRLGESHAVIRLVTGRYHQIRAMMAERGVPLVGDTRYGGPEGTSYLEHAVFRFLPLAGSSPLRLFDPFDPGREVIADRIREALQGAA